CWPLAIGRWLLAVGWKKRGYLPTANSQQPLSSQFPHAHFFEVDRVVVAVVLEADVAFGGARTAVGLPLLLLRRHGVAFPVIRHQFAVDRDYRAVAVERDLHRVP